MVAVRRPVQKLSPPQADERLLVEAAQADPSKFGALYELHFHRIYYFVVSRVGDRAAAEDVTSDVFHKALANLPSYEWRGTPFSAWLYRIASNAVVDRFKRANLEVPVADDPPDFASDSGTGSRHRVVSQDKIEESAALFTLVDKLPAVQRRVIYERFVQQRNIREIAGILKKTEGAVKQLQFRALQTLRAQMEGRHA